MNCPTCSYQSPFKDWVLVLDGDLVVRCPQCMQAFDADRLENLEHLNYLRRRLNEWQAEGSLPTVVASRLLGITDQEVVDIKRALSLLAAPSEAAVEAAPIAEAVPSTAEFGSPSEAITGSAAAPSVSPAEAQPVAASPEAAPVVVPAWVPSTITRTDATHAAGAALARATAPLPRVERATGPAPAPVRPAFSWTDLGNFLLSERTLNGLLALGAFLILASSVVISTVNPTGLSPLPHLTAVMATTAVFYGAGYFVRQRLSLSRTGTTILAIGAAFIPLDIWTLGQPQLLNWERGAMWLAASAVCLPVYFGSHALLQDRTFAILTAFAGASLVLSGFSALFVPLEWGLCALGLLAIAYAVLARRLPEGWAELAWACFWASQVAMPLVMGSLMAAKYFPGVWELVATRPPGGLYEYAIGGGWWIGTAFYFLCSHLYRERRYEYLGAWSLPFAYVFTLTKAPWDGSWYNVCLAALAFGYLALGHLRLLRDGDSQPSLGAIIASPSYQVGCVVALAAALWFSASLESAIATLYTLAATYMLAAYLVRHVAFRYVAAYLVPVAVAVTLQKLDLLGLVWFQASWHNLGFALLAAAYVLVAHVALRVGRTARATTHPYVSLAAEPVLQVALLLTIVAALWPYQVLESRIPMLYVVTGTYALAAYLLSLLECRYVAAYMLPLAVGFSLEKVGALGLAWLERPWHGLAFGALAAGYLLFGRFALRGWRQESGRDRYAALRAEPVFQVALGLTVVSALWPGAQLEAQAPTFFLLAGVYGAAAFLLKQRPWAYVSISLLLVTFAFALSVLRLGNDGRTLSWALVSAALLAAAETAVRRTAEARRPLPWTAVGIGPWRSRFGSPLFLGGYVSGLIALGYGLVQSWNAPAAAGARQLTWEITAALLVLVAVWVASAVTRRASFFLYLATWLFLIPFVSTASLAFAHLGLPWSEAEGARLVAVLGVGYLTIGLVTDRARGHYAKPIYLGGYALSLAPMFFSALDRTVNAQVVGLSVAVCAASAWLVHRGLHPSYEWVVARLFRDPMSVAHRAARSLFLYLAAGLFPVGLVLAMSLLDPLPEAAHYGIVLSVLAPIYGLLGLLLRRVRAEYRLPMYLVGYAVSAIGPLVATPDATLRCLALAVSIGFYIASCAVSRQSGWLYLVAVLTPVLAWQATYRFAMADRFFDLGLVSIGLLYACVGVVLHHGGIKGLAQPIRGLVTTYALPFFTVGYMMGALGLAVAANQERPLLLAAFALAALHYGGSALAFRQSVFGYPLAGAIAVVYVVGMTMTPLDARYYGLGLLPGIAAFLAIADSFRRRSLPEVSAEQGWAGRLGLDSWAMPFYLVLYTGTVAVPLLSAGERGTWAIAWWSAAAVYGASVTLVRHPAWLYPTIGAALVGYVATFYVFLPDLGVPDAMATLIVPAGLLFCGAHILVGRPRPSQSFPWPFLGSRRAPVRRWTTPLLLYALLVVGVSTLGSIVDPGAGLRTTVAYTLLFATVGTVWGGRGEVWSSITFAVIAHEQALRLSKVALSDQPLLWAVSALILVVLSIAIRADARGWLELLRIWKQPLNLASAGIATAALLASLGFALVNQTLSQATAATTAVSGLTLVAQGFQRRERLLGYLGVAIVEAGYMIELLRFEVGQPQAFALPAGVYLLAVAFLEWRRGTGAGIKGVLEVAGLALLAGVSLLQAVGFLGAGADRYAYGAFLFVESLALFGLGAMLRWTKLFFGGAIVLVADVGILLADPLRSMNTWYLAAIVGLLMVALVVFVEQKRKQIPAWLDEWRARLETWD